MSKPNVLWIMSDQQPGYMLGCNGDPNVRTPNLNSLANLGVNATRAVGGYPLCCPFRGAMLTGRYPHHVVPGHEYQLSPEQPTVAHAFREQGYHTGYIGKWHLDGFHESNGRAAFHIIPPERRGGFDTWIGYENNNSQYDCWVHGGEGDSTFHYRLPGYETDALTDLTIDYLTSRAQASEAFFCVLSVQPPHNPYLAPPEYMARYQPQQLTLRPNVPPIARVEQEARLNLAGAYAMVENLDFNIGRICEALERLGLLEDTHIIFFSDHGDMHGSHGLTHKTNPYEESIRVPFIISGGLSHYGVAAGQRTDYPINHVDIAPTSLGLCGLPVPEWMEGCDYSGLRLRKAGEYPDSAYIQSIIPTRHANSIDRPWRGVVTVDGWKYVCFEGAPWLMFDLNEDPYELVNMVHNAAYAAQRQRLHDRLRAWIQDTGDVFTLPEL